MQYFHVNDGVTDLKLSKLMLGSVYFGTTIPDSEVFYMIDQYLDAGGTMVDSARCYAFWVPDGDGSADRAIGRYLRATGKRNQILVGTKGGHMNEKGVNPYRAKLGEKELRRDLEESLGFLGIDCLDIYWLHRDDPRIPVGELVERANEYIKEGKTRMVGVSNWSTERLAAAQAYAAEHGLRPFVMNQIQYSLAKCTREWWGDDTIVIMDEAMEKFYRENNIPVVSYTSQAQGFMAKYIAGGKEAIKPDTAQKFLYPENIERAERVRKLSEETGLTASQITLAYLTNNEVTVSALLGCGNRIQLADSLSAADVFLTPEQIRFLAGR